MRFLALVFIKNMDDFAKINEVYSKHMGEHKPARSCVEVARLPRDVLVEVRILTIVHIVGSTDVQMLADRSYRTRQVSSRQAFSTLFSSQQTCPCPYSIIVLDSLREVRVCDWHMSVGQ